MKISALSIVFLLLLLPGCKNDSPGTYSYRPPEGMNDGLKTGSLPEADIEPALIESVVNGIYQSKFKEVHAMLLLRDGKLVLEEYFPGHDYQWDAPNHHGPRVDWNRDMLHVIHSDSKSVTATCIGIAIDKGFIESVYQSIFDYLPDHQHLKTDGKEKITIEHLLTMTSGLEWDEWGAPYSSQDNDMIGVWFRGGKDPAAYILEKPLAHKPGTHFTYSGGNTILLGEIIRNAARMPIDAFSKKYLFEPLGIDTSIWELRYENGVVECAGSLKLTPRAMAKIGLLFLNKGVWNGKQILSEAWVEKSAAPFPGNKGIKVPGESSGRVGYAYSWWTKQYTRSGKKINLYYAGGFGGQHIMVLPELQAVAVFTGGNYLTYRPPFKILEEYLIPAMIKA